MNYRTAFTSTINFQKIKIKNKHNKKKACIADSPIALCLAEGNSTIQKDTAAYFGWRLEEKEHEMRFIKQATKVWGQGSSGIWGLVPLLTSFVLQSNTSYS